MKVLQRAVLCLSILSLLILYATPLVDHSGAFTGVAEFSTLILWYILCILIPPSIGDFGTSLFVWFCLFIFIAVPTGSDIVYHMTGITPKMWWYEMKSIMPIGWNLQRKLTRSYYVFITELSYALTPGILSFALSSLFKFRRSTRSGGGVEQG